MPSTVAEKNAIEFFIEKTNLIPAVVLDGVVQEVCQYLAGDPAVNLIFETLRNESTVTVIEEKTVHAFASSAGFKKALAAADPRPGYYAFVRHWVSSELKTHFPAQFQKLPSGFKVGQSL